MIWMQIEVESVLKHLAEYHKLVEATIAKDMTDKTENLFQSEDEYDPALFDVELDEAKWIYESYFPRFLRYSLIVTTVMILETQLAELCDVIKNKKGLAVRAKDLKGDTLSQCKKYLEDVAKVSLIQSLWDKVIDLSKVRNCIVHAMGDMELSNDRIRLRDLVKANQGLTTGDTVFSGLEKNTLYISPDYCMLSIENIRQVFEDIFKSAGFQSSA
ncbi:MAG: hypothetical protein HZB51_00160 [Chloroflexi bacterium]|nr:hypothetical protein [Chloroflexota bacterium]